MVDFLDVITMEMYTSGSIINKSGIIRLFRKQVLRGATRHFWQHQLAYERVVLNDRPFKLDAVGATDPDTTVFNLPCQNSFISVQSTIENRGRSHIDYIFSLGTTDLGKGSLVKGIEWAQNQYGDISERLLIPLRVEKSKGFMVARLCDLKIITDNTLEAFYAVDMWQLQLAFGCDAGVSSAKCSAVKSAIDIVNDSFSNPGLLTSVFGRNTFGMNIPVVIDNSDDYSTRKIEAERRRYERCIDDDNCRDPLELENPSNDSFDPTPYDVIDVLGTYSPPAGFITLYVKAIEEFMAELGLLGQDVLTHLCAYVLAHEVFHAYQDFHVDLKSCNHVNGEDPEVSAEYYGLRFVKDILKDDVLFDALCDHRANNRLTGYSDALSKYGDIKDEVSVGDFIKTVASWN